MNGEYDVKAIQRAIAAAKSEAEDAGVSAYAICDAVLHYAVCSVLAAEGEVTFAGLSERFPTGRVTAARSPYHRVYAAQRQTDADTADKIVGRHLVNAMRLCQTEGGDMRRFVDAGLAQACDEYRTTVPDACLKTALQTALPRARQQAQKNGLLA